MCIYPVGTPIGALVTRNLRIVSLAKLSGQAAWLIGLAFWSKGNQAGAPESTRILVYLWSIPTSDQRIAVAIPAGQTRPSLNP